VPAEPLKISVLSNGALYLNGEPTDLDRLGQELAAAKTQNRLVYYYREMPREEPVPEAGEVLKLVVKHQLPVTLSTKPDFSDYVDAQGVPHPRRNAAASPALSMPEVAPRPDIEAEFAELRKSAVGGAVRGVAVLTPERKVTIIPRLPGTPAVQNMTANLNKMIPADTKRNIAGIGYTAAASLSAPNDPRQSAPFFALLSGLCYLGHAVWVFEGHPSALEAGCREADVLIVDSGVRQLLTAGWVDRVAAVMRNANVLVFDRVAAKLMVLKRVGAPAEQLEFAT
jgi:hypothetical protein